MGNEFNIIHKSSQGTEGIWCNLILLEKAWKKWLIHGALLHISHTEGKQPGFCFVEIVWISFKEDGSLLKKIWQILRDLAWESEEVNSLPLPQAHSTQQLRCALTLGVPGQSQGGTQHHQYHCQSCHVRAFREPQTHHAGKQERNGLGSSRQVSGDKSQAVRTMSFLYPQPK